MKTKQAVQCLLLLGASACLNQLHAEQQQPLFINGAVAAGKSVLTKAEIVACLRMQGERTQRDQRTQNSSQQLSLLEKKVLEQEQSLKQQTLQLDKLEVRAKTSPVAMSQFREQAHRYNRQLESFNQLKQDYQAVIAEHNLKIMAYNRYATEYQRQCGSKQYYESDLKQVQAETLNLAEH